MGRFILRALAVLGVLVILTYLAFQLSPWPGAFLIRRTFTREGARLARALRPHVPPGITALRNLPYSPDEPELRLDVYFPDGTHPLPTVVWVHGGAWVAGSKDELANYLQILAGRGFTVIGVDYSLAPGRHYPVPVRQVNQALAYIMAHADRLHVDTMRIYLSGDSGGAQIAAQLALVLRDSTFAAAMALRPALAGARLRGMLLYCGPYDAGAVRLDGAFGGFLRTVLWSYSGRRDFQADTAFARVSVVNYVGPSFPPSFLTVGNADPLAPQSRAMAAALERTGVLVDTLFYPANYPSALPHEYQFNLDTPEGQLALDRTVAFLAANH